MNWKRVAFIPLVLCLGCTRQDAPPSRAATGDARATPTDSSGFAIVKLDPALDTIVSADATLDTIGDRFGLTEGPVWVQEGASGYLLFSDLIANVIYKWTPDGQLSAFLENIYDGPDILNVGQQTRRGRMNVIIIGSNGLTLDREGRLIIASPASRAVFRLEKDGKRTVLADRYDGKRFNGPNDVVVKSNGSIYFTDGNSGLRGGANSPLREIPFNGFYLVRDGKVTLVGSNKDFTRRIPERHRLVARRETPLRHHRSEDHALRRAAGRHRRQWHRVPGCRRQRRTEGGRERQRVFHDRRRARRSPDHLSRGQASRHASASAANR